MSRKKELAERVINEYKNLKTAHQVAENLHSAIIKDLDNSSNQTTSIIENEYKNSVQRVRDELNRVRQDAAKTIQSAISSTGVAALPWGSPGWLKHSPPADTFPPALLRIGELRANHIYTTLPSMPALVPITGQRHILISFENSQSQLGSKIIESLAWRIAALSSPAFYRFILFDPLGLGINLASLLKLPEDIRGQKIWCDDQDIEKVLRELDQDVQDLIQHRLLNTYTDIEAYNKANPDVAVPFHFLVFVGFPKSFTPKSGEMLMDIARVGRRAGYYLLGGVVRGEKPPYGFDFTTFMNSATYVSVKKGNQLEWNDPDFTKISIQPDTPPSSALIDRLVQTIQPLIVSTSATTVPFSHVAVHKANWWQANSTDGLVIPIGLDEGGGTYTIGIGQGGAHHALVGGATGMGKTNLLHLLVVMLGTAYSPEELELYLVDFKEGVEFQDYVTHALPHAQAVVLEAEREFGSSILQRLVEKMEERSQAFKVEGVNDIQEYRKRTGRSMSRILLVMDEYVVLFSEDDRLAFQASEALAALVMRGRAFGIHVLISAQRPSSTFLSISHIKSQMGLRLAFKCRPEDSSLILGEGNEKAARLSPQPGEACVTSDPDQVSATTQVRIARLNPDERVLYLRGLQEFSRLRNFKRREPMIVFSRKAPAIWLQSRRVAERMATTSWSSLPVPLFWLGQPLRIAEDLAIPLEFRQGANLLVLGSDEALGMRLLLSALLGLCLTLSPLESRFIFIGNPDPHQPVGQAFASLQRELRHAIQFYARQAAVDKFNELAGELDNRLSQLPTRPRERIFLLIGGLHRWIEARGPNPYTPSPTGEQLTRLCQQGPEVGIHTLMWSDRLSSLGAVTGTASPHETLAQFEHRVALQMASDESVNFLGTPHAAKLGSERAFYRSEQWPADVLDKFKPFATPSQTELRSVIDAMKSRWSKT